MRIIIHQDGTVVVTKPWWASKKRAEKFLADNRLWVLEKVQTCINNGNSDLTTSSREHYLDHKEAARKLVQVKLDHWSEVCELPYNRVSIRDQKTRWGSCSSDGNLNFSYKILFLPERLQDYLIVHELCHLKEMNHSSRFWALVEEMLPGHASCRRDLRRIGKKTV